MIIDPIGDLIARIKNGGASSKEVVMAPYSRTKENVLKVLREEGFIEGYEIVKNENKSDLKIFLKYFEDKHVIHEIKRVSKPGRRVYTEKALLRPVYNGLGIAIITTSKGVMTDINAKKQGLGGEILCNVF